MLRSLMLALVLAVTLSACAPQEQEPLVLYSGRSKSLVEPLINQYAEQAGIQVDVRYGDTAQLAVALLEEGDQSPADVFWAQDAGALGAVHADGLFATLPDSIMSKVAGPFQGSGGTWIGTSGRARTLAWSLERVTEESLPTSILDLTDPQYAGRVGWAPTNGSFQAAVTALRQTIGTDSTRAWLVAMRDNGAKAYGNNRAIIEAIAAGEVDLGLPNHYYLYRYTEADANYPVAQRFFGDGDPGNLINVAGVGVLAASDNQDAATAFVNFLVSAEAQAYFATENFEYPLVPGTPVPDVLGDAARIAEVPPQLNLDDLRDLEATLDLLREVGLL